MDSLLESFVWERARGFCEYCQMLHDLDELTFEIDHIIAQKHGGETKEGNLALACFPGNRHKSSDLSGIDSETHSVARLFDPRNMNWNRHFRWDGPWLVGKTKTGRATVATLAINAPGGFGCEVN